MNEQRNYIKNVNVEKGEVEKMINLVEYYKYPIQEDTLFYFFLLNVYSVEIKLSFNEGKRIYNSQEQYFMNKLEQDKIDFEAELKKLNKMVNQSKSFSDYRQLSTYATKTNQIKLKLEDAKEKVKNFN